MRNLMATATLLALLALLPPTPGLGAAEMVHRDNFRMIAIEDVKIAREHCGPFAGDPDRLVYELVTGLCDDPGPYWVFDDVQEVQVTRAWARLGYMSYQVAMLGLADDSVGAFEWRFELTPVDDDVWQLDFAGQRWRCWPGRGPSDGWHTKPCE